MNMGWLFKTPSDDAVEGTLRQLHMANQVDRVYERTWGWVKALICSAIAVVITSGVEYYTNVSLYNIVLDSTLGWITGLF
jgi:hypothetical protein